jgi:hypothetical protein
MISLRSHRDEVCDPRKLKPEPFHDAASGTNIVEVDGSSFVGGEAARRAIEPPDDFAGIMLSRECDDHRAPFYINNLLLYGEIFYHRQFLLQLCMSCSYNGLVFMERLPRGTSLHHNFSNFYYNCEFFEDKIC